MFMSGFVAGYSHGIGTKNFINKKFYALVVPFVAWYVLSYFLNGAYHTYSFVYYIHRWVLSPDWGLWFLWVLFLNFVILYICEKLIPRTGPAVYLAAWLALQIVPLNYFGLELTRWMFGFFIVGYIIKKYDWQRIDFLKRLSLISLVAYPLLVHFWYRQRDLAPSYRLTQLSPILTHPRAIHDLSITFNYLIAFTGIVFWYALWRLLDTRRAGLILVWLGGVTMEIYVSHLYFMRFAFGTGALKVLSGFSISLTLSLLLGLYVLRPNNVLNRVLLGGRGKATKTIASGS